MSSYKQIRFPAPIVYIGPARRMKIESSAVALSHATGRIVSATKLVQHLIDACLDNYVAQLAAESAES